MALVCTCRCAFRAMPSIAYSVNGISDAVAESGDLLNRCTGQTVFVASPWVGANPLRGLNGPAERTIVARPRAVLMAPPGCAGRPSASPDAAAAISPYGSRTPKVAAWTL